MPTADQDQQLTPLTALQISALAVFAEQPRHPYEVYQLMLERREDRVVKLRPGSLYHAINRLVQTELLTATGTGREGNRPERTTYRITSAGRAALTSHVTAMLRARAEEYPQFPLAIAEMHNLDADTARAALEERLLELRTEVELAQEGRVHVESIDLPEVLWLDNDYLLAMTHAELAWTEQLVGRLASGDLTWDRSELGTGRATRRPPSLTVTPN